MPKCHVCHNHCDLSEGAVGLCKARICRDGKVVAGNYGHITSIALDPIEKKPLNLFYPGSKIISVGSYGCNLRCPFCQNHEISYDFGKEYPYGYREISPKELAEIALEYKDEGNIGVAFTYNEPLVGYEFVVDAAKEVHERGMKTVLVSNGCVTGEVAKEVIPHIDAMNIDLKGFTDKYYQDVLKGDRRLVMDFISMAAPSCHLEVTMLVVPGFNDTEEDMRKAAKLIAEIDPLMPLHVTRFFPAADMKNVMPTRIDVLLRLVEVAKEYLTDVIPGNI